MGKEMHGIKSNRESRKGEALDYMKEGRRVRYECSWSETIGCNG